MDSLFNNQGELNASSVQDALQVIAKYASVLQNQPSNTALQTGLTEDQRDELISRAMFSQDGKLALAQTMANPIRRNLDYQGIFRRLVVVDNLAQGVLPVYERDIDVAATIVSSNGSAPESRVFGDRFTVPTWEVVSNPTVRIREARMRRFNIVERAVQKARQEIMAQEDANGFAALEAASTVENAAQSLNTAGLVKRDLVKVKQQVEKWDLVVSKFVMNINEYNDMLMWSSSGPANGDLDPESHRELLQTGIRGHLWGADILVSKMVPAGNVYALAEPEFVGVLPVRQDIEVLPADEPRRLSLGWVVSEEIGIAIANPRAVSKGGKNV